MAKKLNSNSVAALKKVKTKKPIFVEPGDPRIRMYEDSLALHNAFEGTNPIEIDKNFSNRIYTGGQRTPKPTPKSNFNPLATGPYGSKISPAITTQKIPLNAQGETEEGPGVWQENGKYKQLVGLYGALYNNQKRNPNDTDQMSIAMAGKKDLAYLIAEDLYRAQHNIKREFAPIAYKTSPIKDKSFIGDSFTTDVNITKTLPPKTAPVENIVDPNEVRKIYPKISDKDLAALIAFQQNIKNRAVVKNGKIKYVEIGDKNQGNVADKVIFAPQETAITTPVFAAPEQPYIAKTPLPKRVPAIVPGLITPKTVPVPVTTPIEPNRVPVEVPVVPNDIVVPEEKIPVTPPVVRKPPKAIMPTRQGGWSKQPLLMRLFPKLYMK
jgi:hypothetical protein